ncbi:MAG: tetratricopeptide repeat protein [Desulfobacteraceae bacterium]|nr:MAG: tetratricopeptide repeat protein [Desulfobacteraceae bacterium]
MKKNWHTTFGLLAIAVSLIAAGTAAGGVTPGHSAPAFSLPDIQGRQHTLSQIQGRQMTVLFFFDTASSASQEGLLMLDALLGQYGDKQLSVWGITRSPKEAVLQFNRKAQVKFPILLDNADVSSRYEAKLILPVVCTIGPGLEVLDYFQGGGKTAEVMLVRLAERQIHRDQPGLARAIAASVAQKDPANIEAKSVQGYAALAEGRTDEARQVFDQIAAGPDQSAVIGQEGQAAVLAKQGKTDQALALADKTILKAPRRSQAHKIRGDLLIGKGDRQGAAQAYEKAVQQTEAPLFLKAEARNQLGRMYAQDGKYSEARALFDQAVSLDPYYLEPTSNKGVTYEKEGLWSKALTEYRQALALNQADSVAAVLARKAEQMLALQQDTAGKQRMDQLIGTLVERYKSQKTQAAGRAEDEWTSRPLVLTFVDIQERGGLSSRDGLAVALATRLGELLSASGRVQVVERVVLERLLSELNLGASELADPQTALKLGRLLAAKLIGTGSLLYLPDSTLMNLRVIDTETSAVAKTITHRMTAAADLERELFDVNRALLKMVTEQYPLQGYVVQADGKEAMINLGQNQGVTTGTAFEVIEPGEAVIYKGRALRGQAKRVGRLEVVRVAPDLSFARIVQAQRAPARDDQIREVVAEAVTKSD